MTPTCLPMPPKSERIVVSKSALQLLSKVANAGKRPFCLDDSLGPKVRRGQKVELPLPHIWDDARRPFCSRDASKILQTTLSALNEKDKSALPYTGPPIPPLQFQHNIDKFERLPYYLIRPETVKTAEVTCQESVTAPERKRKYADNETRPMKKAMTDPGPAPFTSALQIYHHTQERSVGSSWGNGEHRSTARSEQLARQTKYVKHDVKSTSAKAPCGTAPDRAESVSTTKAPPWQAEINQRQSEAREAQGEKMEKGEKVCWSAQLFEMGLDDNIADESAESSKVSRPSTSYGDFPDEVLEKVRHMEMASSNTFRMPAKSDSTIKTIPSGVEPLSDGKSHSHFNTRLKELRTKIDRDNKETMMHGGAEPQRELLFNPPFAANISATRQSYSTSRR